MNRIESINKKIIKTIFCILICLVVVMGLLSVNSNNTIYANNADLQNYLNNIPRANISEIYSFPENEGFQPMFDWVFDMTPARRAEVAALNQRAIGWETRAEYLTGRTISTELLNQMEDTTETFESGLHPITQIIPRELFVHRGEYLFIGERFGFFIKTQNLQEKLRIPFRTGEQYRNFISIIIFQICVADNLEEVLDDRGLISGTVGYNARVEKLFARNFIYNTETWYSGSPNRPGTLPSIQHITQQSVFFPFVEYLISSPTVNFDIFNIEELNHGDDGYVGTNDNGLFIILTSFEGAASGLPTINHNLEINSMVIVDFIAGYVLPIFPGGAIISNTYNVFRFGQDAVNRNMVRDQETFRFGGREHFQILALDRGTQLNSGPLRKSMQFRNVNREVNQTIHLGNPGDFIYPHIFLST